MRSKSAPPAPRRRRRARGFSFIEVMAVVVIIGMLAGAVALNFAGSTDKAKVSRAKSDIAQVVSAVELYYINHSRYPTNGEGLGVVSLKSNKDPWGNAYQYNSPGRDGPFEIVSFGADGRPGGEGKDADLYSWQLNDVDAEP